MNDNTKKISVLDEKTHEVIPANQLFGDDADAVSDLCMQILDDALYYTHRSHTNCYRSPSRPKTTDFVKNPGWVSLYKKAQKDWEKENPDEVHKERVSQEAWDAAAKARFANLFRLAKKHHVRLKWQGTSPYFTPTGGKEQRCINTPDRWFVYQNGEVIAQIYCF